PAMGSYSFSTDEDFQDQITLEFHRSSESMASPESFIGQVRIRGYKLEGAREPLVRLYYEIANQQIAIWATNEKDNGELALSESRILKGRVSISRITIGCTATDFPPLRGSKPVREPDVMYE